MYGLTFLSVLPCSIPLIQAITFFSVFGRLFVKSSRARGLKIIEPPLHSTKYVILFTQLALRIIDIMLTKQIKKHDCIDTLIFE